MHDIVSFKLQLEELPKKSSTVKVWVNLLAIVVVRCVYKRV